jgi:hypothetical protein
MIRGVSFTMRSLAVISVVLALTPASRPALADEPLAPTTRLHKPAHIVHHHMRGVGYRANGPSGTIGVLDLRTGGVIREIEVGQRVDLVALSESGQWLYAITPDANVIVVIEVATERVFRRARLSPPPIQE